MPLASTFDSNFTCCHCQQYFVFGAEILQSYCRTDTMRITRYVRKFQTFVLKAAIIELQQYKNCTLPNGDWTNLFLVLVLVHVHVQYFLSIH